MTLTATRFDADADAIAKISGNYSVAVTAADVTTALGYGSNQHVKSIAVLDSASAISSHLDDLVGLGLRLKEVRGSDSSVFEVTANQLQTDSLVIGKMYKGYQLSVMGASLSQSMALMSNKKVVTVAVEDTAANITAQMPMLAKMGSSLTSIHVTDASSNTLSLTSALFGKYVDVLDKMSASDNYQVDIQGATAAEAQALLDNSHVASVSVADNAQAISAAFDQLMANTKLESLALTGKDNLLDLSHTQLTAGTETLEKLISNYVLNITGIGAVDALALVEDNARVSTLEVEDTTDAITAHLDDLASLGARLTAITDSDNASFALTQSQWRNAQTVLDKITGGYNVDLSDVSATSAASVAADGRVQSLAVTDTGAAISANLNMLHSLGVQLTSIEQSDTANSIQITASQWVNAASTLSKLGESSTFAVMNAAASQVDALGADERVTSIAVSDSSANIASRLNAIQDTIESLATAGRTVPITLRQLGLTAPLQLTETQLTRDHDALAAITGCYSLDVKDVLAADVTGLATNAHITTMTVRDTGSAVTGQLAALTTLGNKLSTVQQTDLTHNISLTLSEWQTYAPLLKKFQYGVHANLTGVNATQANSLAADSRIDHVTVSDTAAQVSAKLDALQAMGPDLTGITLTDVDTNPVQLSMQQLSTHSATLAKITGDYTLFVRNASAVEAETLLGNSYSHVSRLSVADTSANIAAALDQLSANTKLSNITQTGVAQPLPITVAQITSNSDGLGKITGTYSLSVSDATASDVAALVANAHVSSMVVTDTAAHVQAHLEQLTAAAGKLFSVALSDAPATLTLSYSDWLANRSTLEKIGSDFNVAVTDVSAANAYVLASDPRVSLIDVSDTTARIQSNLDALNGIQSKLGTITPTDATPGSMTITAAQYTGDANVLALMANGSYSLNVTGANVNQAQALSSDSHVVGMTVTDTSENLLSQLSSLDQNTKITSIRNTTPTATMTLSDELLISSASTLAKFNNYQLSVTDALASKATDLMGDSHVVSFTISDTSSAISSAMSATSDSLPSMLSKLTALSVTDGPIEASQAQLNQFAGTNDFIETLANITGNYTLSLTGVSIDNLGLLTPSGSQSNLVLNPGASDPLVIDLSKIVSLAVTDTSAHVAEAFDSLINLGNTLNKVTLSNVSVPIALTPDQFTAGAAVLGKVEGNYRLALVDVLTQDALGLSSESKVDTISIRDTAANIAADFDTLQTILSKIQSIEISDGNDLLLTQAQYDSDLANKVVSTTMVVSA